ncbi:hypothetical protein FRC05_001350 [Tulasnella sp. 425]|nr:hypothetical protein FRC05_001350 [Tulasnella sp. 425]
MALTSNNPYPPSPLMERLHDVLLPWQTSKKSVWKYNSRVPNLPIIQVDRQLFHELTPGSWTSGETVTTFLDIWHSREYIYNTLNAESLRISNTYLYPTIQSTLKIEAGTEARRRALVNSLVHFRYKASKDLERTLGDLFSAYYYLAIPLHVLGGHWALAIVVNVNGVAEAGWNPSHDCALIFLLDSLSGDGAANAVMRAGRNIRQWLRDVLRVLLGRERDNGAFRIIHVPETAQQPNGSDCGLYVHHHLRSFMAASNPERIIPHYQSNEGLLSEEDLVELWRYPTAVDCRFNVTQLVISELRNQGNIS